MRLNLALLITVPVFVRNSFLYVFLLGGLQKNVTVSMSLRSRQRSRLSRRVCTLLPLALLLATLSGADALDVLNPPGPDPTNVTLFAAPVRYNSPHYRMSSNTTFDITAPLFVNEVTDSCDFWDTRKFNPELFRGKVVLIPSLSVLPCAGTAVTIELQKVGAVGLIEECSSVEGEYYNSISGT